MVRRRRRRGAALDARGRHAGADPRPHPCARQQRTGRRVRAPCAQRLGPRSPPRRAARRGLAVAAQACLPVLRLGLDAYDGFVGIVMHSDEVVARREITDESGVVHQYDETLTGEAMEGGPVMLSWHDVESAGESAEWGYNVVIHEFAHVLDMRDGLADGVPLLSDRAARERWLRVINAEYSSFCDAVDSGHDTLLDPYGAESIDEFFAV